MSLIRQMNSQNVEVQCNAVGCITNLATHEENKAKIAKSGALGPLTKLAKSKGHEGSAERHWRSAKHDTFWSVQTSKDWSHRWNRLSLTALQMKTGNNWSPPARSQSWCSC